MANNVTPFRVLTSAVKAVPAVRYALGVAGIMAALALGKAFFASTSEALIGAAFMLVLMFLLVVFAAAARTDSSAQRALALTATWALLILFVGSAALLVSSTFFAWPLPLSDLVKPFRGTDVTDDGGQPEAAVFTRDSNVIPDNLPQRFVTPVSQGAGPGAVLKALSRKGSLVLDGSKLTVAPIGANVSLTLAVQTLTLSHGAQIITNGNNLTIQAVSIVGGGSIIAFRPEDRTPPPSATGQSGVPGHAGGNVFLDVENGIDGNLTVDLTGQNGGAGGPGGPGPGGQAGVRGANAVEGLFDCRSGGGDGGPGAQGGQGQAGGNGGDGGSGGDLFISRALEPQESRIIRALNGGALGSPGQGGPGGPGGPGGEGGSGSLKCSGGHGGPQGPPGTAGPNGNPGSPGKAGNFKVR